ncbi:hypothetical protein QYF61_027220 [Mycteria americana]|uniref:Uncharacterized protein n=1 Tax=Mycteria americana TaxID=33587 RepID=A0AAN7S1B3_MYCAM|nr:hypothetical protein QYF61_027220 [Mycteria americana]
MEIGVLELQNCTLRETVLRNADNLHYSPFQLDFQKALIAIRGKTAKDRRDSPFSKWGMGKENRRARRRIARTQAGQPHINHQKELPHVPHYRLGAKHLESSFAEKDLGILVDTKLNMSQQRVLTAKKPKTIRKSITRKSRENHQQQQ